MNPTPKLDIFRVLKELAARNIKFFDSLNEVEQKAFQPLIVMRWLTGTKNKQQIFLINELLNKYVFSLSAHKGLLYKIMSICVADKYQHFSWVKKASGATTHPRSTKAVQQYFGYNTADANKACLIISPMSIVDIAEELGWQDDELNVLRKEWGLPTTRKPRTTNKAPAVFDDSNSIEL
jgi:hypothetical protein